MADAQAIAAAGRPVRSPRSGDGRVATDEGLFAPASIERWDRDPAAFSALAGAAVDWWEADLGRGLAWRELLIAENDGRPIGFVQLCRSRTVPPPTVESE